MRTSCCLCHDHSAQLAICQRRMRQHDFCDGNGFRHVAALTAPLHCVLLCHVTPPSPAAAHSHGHLQAPGPHLHRCNFGMTQVHTPFGDPGVHLLPGYTILRRLQDCKLYLRNTVADVVAVRWGHRCGCCRVIVGMKHPNFSCSLQCTYRTQAAVVCVRVWTCGHFSAY